MGYEIDSNKKLITILCSIIIFLVIILILILITSDNNIKKTHASVIETENTSQIKKEERKHNPENIEILTTGFDEVYDNSTWSGVFQLVWKEMVNELTDGNIVLQEPVEIVENLNKQISSEVNISEKNYYKKWDLKTTKLKSEIEKELKSKFNETSNVLSSVSWAKGDLNNAKDKKISKYLFYVMLKKDFKFKNEFTILENGKFGDNYENIKYFGINNQTSDEVRKQINVLYYNSENDMAVLLNTNDGEQIFLVKYPEGKTFQEIYDIMNKKAFKYNEKKTFGNEDTLKVPNLNINQTKNYEQLHGIQFTTKKGTTAEIQNAIQTIKVKLDNAGENPSENKNELNTTSSNARNFNFDDTFTLFLKETYNDKPYFAINVTDINLFQ